MSADTFRELQLKGLAGLQKFMELANSNDPLLANGLVTVRGALVLADTLNGKKDKAARTTAELKQINEVLNEIRKYTPTGTDTEANMTLPAAGTQERKDLIARWQAAGVEIKIEDTPKQKDSTSWQAILSTRSDTVSSTSQRDQLELQTVLTRYNEKWELTTSLFKTFESIMGRITENFR